MSNRGGYRPNSGRKPNPDGNHLVTARLTADQIIIAKLIGDDNLSAGIRCALDAMQPVSAALAVRAVTPIVQPDPHAPDPIPGPDR